MPTNHAQEGADYDENIARLKQWIDIAATMGVPMVRTFGGWHRPGMPSEEDTIQKIIGSIKVCAAYAAEKKVLIGLHNHNHGQIPSTGEQALKILDGVASPYFVGLMDTGQWHGSPGIGEGPEGNEEGTERGTVDAKFDYMASIRMW